MAEDVERADRLALMTQRDDELRCHAGDDRHVPLVGGDIVDEERRIAGNRRADEPFAEPHSPRLIAFRISDRVRDFELAATLVEEVRGKGVERNEPADQTRNLWEQLVEVKHPGDLAPE